MHLVVQHLPEPDRDPWCVVLQTGTSEVRQERHPTRSAAVSALPEIAKILRRIHPGRRVEFEVAA